MAIREHISLVNRYPAARVGTVEPFRTYYLIIEGTNTEPQYFRLLEKKMLRNNLRHKIRFVFLERTENDVGSNSPRQLLNFLLTYQQEKNDPDGQYVMIFDRDSFKNHPHPLQSYLDFLKKTKKLAIKKVVSSPCFEIWLLLHHPQFVNQYLRGKEEQLLENPRLSSSFTFASRLVYDLFGFNPKTEIPHHFLDHLPTAMRQRYELTTDLYLLGDHLGENIGDLIKEWQEDPRQLS